MSRSAPGSGLTGWYSSVAVLSVRGPHQITCRTGSPCGGGGGGAALDGNDPRHRTEMTLISSCGTVDRSRCIVYRRADRGASRLGGRIPSILVTRRQAADYGRIPTTVSYAYSGMLPTIACHAGSFFVHGPRAVNRGEVTGRASLSGANMKTRGVLQALRHIPCTCICMYVYGVCM